MGIYSNRKKFKIFFFVILLLPLMVLVLSVLSCNIKGIMISLLFSVSLVWFYYSSLMQLEIGEKCVRVVHLQSGSSWKLEWDEIQDIVEDSPFPWIKLYKLVPIDKTKKSIVFTSLYSDYRNILNDVELKMEK